MRSKLQYAAKKGSKQHSIAVSKQNSHKFSSRAAADSRYQYLDNDYAESYHDHQQHTATRAKDFGSAANIAFNSNNTRAADHEYDSKNSGRFSSYSAASTGAATNGYTSSNDN